jgi:hypothetical protein
VIPPVVADTGGLLRALARTPDGQPSFPEYERILTSAAVVIVPGLVLAEVDYFLRTDRRAMRKLVAEIFDPATRYEYEAPVPSISPGRWNWMRSSQVLTWGWSMEPSLLLRSAEASTGF